MLLSLDQTKSRVFLSPKTGFQLRQVAEGASCSPLHCRHTCRGIPMIPTFVDAIAETPTKSVTQLELKVTYLQETPHIGKRRRSKRCLTGRSSQMRLLLHFHHCPRFLEVVFKVFPRAKQLPVIGGIVAGLLDFTCHEFDISRSLLPLYVFSVQQDSQPHGRHPSAMRGDGRGPASRTGRLW